MSTAFVLRFDNANVRGVGMVSEEDFPQQAGSCWFTLLPPHPREVARAHLLHSVKPSPPALSARLVGWTDGGDTMRMVPSVHWHDSPSEVTSSLSPHAAHSSPLMSR